MFTSIWKVVEANQTDFWLNIAAGLPFMVFDLVIITLLLPVTVRWWDERVWRNTRLIALQRLLDTYEDFGVRTGEVGQEISTIEKLSGYPGLALETDDDGDSFARDCAVSVMMRLDQYVTRIELEVQTVLQIFNPQMTQDVLLLHYAIRRHVETLVMHLREVVREFDDGSVRNDRGSRSDEDVVRYQFGAPYGDVDSSTIEIIKNLKRLRVAYAPSLALAASHRGHVPCAIIAPTDLLHGLRCYLDRSLGFKNPPMYTHPEIKDRYYTIVRALLSTPAPRVYAAALWQRALGRDRVAVLDALQVGDRNEISQFL